MPFRRCITRTGIAAGTVGLCIGVFCVLMGLVASGALRAPVLLLQTGFICFFAAANFMAFTLLSLLLGLRPLCSSWIDRRLPCSTARIAKSGETDIADNVVIFGITLSACCGAVGPTMMAIFPHELVVASRPMCLALNALVLTMIAVVQLQKACTLQLHSGSRLGSVSGIRLLRFLCGTNAIGGGAILLAYHMAGGPVSRFVSLLLGSTS